MNKDISAEFDSELNKKRGKRLQKCRKMKNLTQSELAQMVGYEHPNSISQLENGARPIDWNKAIPISKCLNVNPAYIMCESDLMAAGSRQTTIDIDIFGARDVLFLRFLIASGHSLIFHVIRLYDERPAKENGIDYSGSELRLLEIDSTIDNLKELCLSDAHCKLQTDDQTSEVIINGVTLDHYRMSFGHFVYTVNRLYDYIHFTLDNIKMFHDDYDYQINGVDYSIRSEIMQAPYYVNTTVEEAISKVKKAFPDYSIEIANDDMDKT